MIYLKLFLSFVQIGLFSIGGGYAAMPLIQSQVVNVHGWLTLNEFTDLISIAEMTPGPITINSATFVGNRIGGIPGALIATLGCILPSCILVSLLAYVYYRHQKAAMVQGVLSALRPTVVALIASAGLTIFLGVVMRDAGLSYLSIFLAGAGLLVLRKWKWNPILTMVSCGGIALLVYVISGGRIQ